MSQRVQDAAAFIDTTLQNEGSWYRADDVETRIGGALASYGASVGAIRGTVRDARRKFKELDHDEVTALASLLWGQPGPGRRPVFERRLAAVVLLQSSADLLRHTDLTRVEGFIRTARTAELVTPLVADVVLPLLAGLKGKDRQRAETVIGRWRQDPEDSVRQAATQTSGITAGTA
ncbi:DNA alkylation repair protein [Arthrobacter sp. HMWF013]|uniref:DNA alkylation repair protein n=1 Tax=Arthrobacter sp. HMWF013 TaxID=2056849 RepID=UPI000D339F65|nr:DNA alkylation repair protein [Arthrobacter sp. HMWF013]PTT65391.1 DNA alkylation repair protein [Arthrobacter sp. HMWF013]